MQISRELKGRQHAGNGEYSTTLQTTHKIGDYSLMVTSTHTQSDNSDGPSWSGHVSVWTVQLFRTGWTMLFAINEGIEWHAYDSLHEQLIEKAKILLNTKA